MTLHTTTTRERARRPWRTVVVALAWSMPIAACTHATTDRLEEAPEKPGVFSARKPVASAGAYRPALTVSGNGIGLSAGEFSSPSASSMATLT